MDLYCRKQSLTKAIQNTGAQALKALKEAGVQSVLINPNIATIQTNHFIADEIYYRTWTPLCTAMPSHFHIRAVTACVSEASNLPDTWCFWRALWKQILL